MNLPKERDYVKKKLSIALIVVAVIVGAVFAWRIAYSMRKNTDNLPALTTIAEMSESDVNGLLPGYKINQLREVWGEPDSSEDGTDGWQIGNTMLIVNYKNNGVVAICGLKDAGGASVEETESQTEPAVAHTLDCKSLQEACADGFNDPSKVTVLGGEWAYTADPNKYVALATVRYTDKDDEYETADFLMLGVFGGEIELYHMLNAHSPYTRENGLQEFGAVDGRRFPLE